MANHRTPFRLIRSNGTAVFSESFTTARDAQTFVTAHKSESNLMIGDHLFGIPTELVVGNRFSGRLDESTSRAVLRVGLDGTIHIDHERQ
ncbi:MAG: hypothetical protein WC544_02525 [Patescibacteria group bacterium]